MHVLQVLGSQSRGIQFDPASSIFQTLARKHFSFVRTDQALSDTQAREALEEWKKSNRDMVPESYSHELFSTKLPVSRRVTIGQFSKEEAETTVNNQQ